ncbi:MAG: copper transporter [Micrococcales bacterium]|nr:copper transporter [Micrococcales bacterium]
MNFRYHIVSLVSVFLALAVGIVLGAGPLRGPIESGFEDQIKSLRADKDVLRSELDQALAINQFAGDGFEATWTELIDGELAETPVAILAYGPDLEERLEAVRLGLDRAGAELTNVVRLEDKYFDLGGAERVDIEAALLELGLERGQDLAGDLISQALAAVLAGRLPPAALPGGEEASDAAPVGGGEGLGGEAVSPSPDSGEGNMPAEPVEAFDVGAAWDILSGARLLGGEAPSQAAQVVVVLTSHLDQEDKAPANDELEGRAETANGLWLTLAKQELSVVICGPSSQEGDLVALGRAEEALREVVSTLDAPVIAAEVIGAVRAAGLGLQGIFGDYGLGGPGEQALPPAPPRVVENGLAVNGGGR